MRRAVEGEISVTARSAVAARAADHNIARGLRMMIVRNALAMFLHAIVVRDHRTALHYRLILLHHGAVMLHGASCSMPSRQMRGGLMGAVAHPAPDPVDMLMV